MKTVSATIDGHLVILNVPESLHEFREGARLCTGPLMENEGYFFDFGKHERLVFENSDVGIDLTLLFMDKLIGTTGVVSEVKHLTRYAAEHVTSDYIHSMAIELPKVYCDERGIGRGSIVGFYYGDVEEIQEEDNDS